MSDTTLDLAGEPLHRIADRIAADWQPPYFAAVPYIRAMSRMESHTDRYGQDDGHMVVRYFLANARTWRGPVARAVKAELKARVA